MRVVSTAFEDGQRIPAEHTCDDKNINPPLTFSEVPKEAASLTLVVDDPDAPSGTFTHWLIYDMSPATMQILEDGLPETGKQGTNGFGQATYGGPCPPSGSHRYRFRLYALDRQLGLPPGAARFQVDEAIGKSGVLEKAELVGVYSRSMPR